MFSTNEELEITIDCLINKIWELKNLLRISKDKAKSLEEQAERVKDETRKLNDLEAKNFTLSKDIKALEEEMQELEIRNNGFLKENKILKEKIKRVMKELDKSKEL